MSLADSLDDVSGLTFEIERLRRVAADREIDAQKARDEADVLELEMIERRAAAHILRYVGLTVDRTLDGTPRYNVERTIAADTDRAGGRG